MADAVSSIGTRCSSTPSVAQARGNWPIQIGVDTRVAAVEPELDGLATRAVAHVRPGRGRDVGAGGARTSTLPYEQPGCAGRQ